MDKVNNEKNHLAIWILRKLKNENINENGWRWTEKIIFLFCLKLHPIHYIHYQMDISNIVGWLACWRLFGWIMMMIHRPSSLWSTRACVIPKSLRLLNFFFELKWTKFFFLSLQRDYELDVWPNIAIRNYYIWSLLSKHFSDILI